MDACQDSLCYLLKEGIKRLDTPFRGANWFIVHSDKWKMRALVREAFT